jgi:hypothetical protein
MSSSHRRSSSNGSDGRAKKHKPSEELASAVAMAKAEVDAAEAIKAATRDTRRTLDEVDTLVKVIEKRNFNEDDARRQLYEHSDVDTCGICSVSITRTAENELDAAYAHHLCEHCFKYAACISCGQHFTQKWSGDGGTCGYCMHSSFAKLESGALIHAFAQVTKVLHHLSREQFELGNLKSAYAIAFITRDLAYGRQIKVCRSCDAFKDRQFMSDQGWCADCSHRKEQELYPSAASSPRG